MRYSLVGEIGHRYVWVDSSFTHRESIGFIPAVWYGLVSYPGRCWGCTVMLENGAVYRNLPPHAIGFIQEPVKRWRPRDAQTWDCYGWDWTYVEYEYLRGLDCRVNAGGRFYTGQYMFTVAPVGDQFSSYPDQAKEFMFIQLDNGRLTVQPTNHLVFRERSFTKGNMEFPKGLKRQNEVYTAE
jgi:hypothetical protein